MSTSYLQDKTFRDALIDTSLLENAIEWIASNMEPEDVFDEAKLRTWAKDMGFVEDNG